MGKNTKIDQELVASLRKGDLLAFDHLFTKYSKKLFYFAKGYLHSTEDAEELVQDVFVMVWEKRKDLKSHLSFNSYLFTVSFNAIRKHFRKKARERKHLNNYLADLVLNEDTTTSEIQYNELCELVNKAIDGLPEKRKIIYKLSRQEGISNDDIARQLNVSKKTVENQISFALKFIREQLGQNFLSTILFFYLFIL